MSKCAHSIDDGWWQGEVEGRIGNFPSLVVEECDEFGEPLTNQWDESPPQSAPPVFTPPEVPNYLVDSDDLEGTPDVVHSPPTQPPPPAPPEDNQTTETPTLSDGVADQDIAATTSQGGFAMSLSRDQQNQYGSQFSNHNDVPSKYYVHIGVAQITCFCAFSY